MNIEELDKIHSQLRDLATKRAADIAATGKDFTLEGTERQFKACVNSDMTSAMFETSTPLQVGQIYESKTGPIFILATDERPGCKMADVAPVKCMAQSFTKQHRHALGGKVEQLAPTATRVPVLKQSGDTITTGRCYAFMTGSVLKTSSGVWEVTGSRLEGSKAHLSVRPYRDPQASQAPQVKRHQKEMPSHWRTHANAPWSSTDSYRGW